MYRHLKSDLVILLHIYTFMLSEKELLKEFALAFSGTTYRYRLGLYRNCFIHVSYFFFSGIFTF